MIRSMILAALLLLSSTSLFAKDMKKNAWGLHVGSLSHKFDCFIGSGYDRHSTSNSQDFGIFYSRTVRDEGHGQSIAIVIETKRGVQSALLTVSGVSVRAATKATTVPVIVRFNTWKQVDNMMTNMFVGMGGYYSHVTNHSAYVARGETIPPDYEWDRDFNKRGVVFEAGGGVTFDPGYSIFLMYRAYEDLDILGDKGNRLETPKFFSWGFHAGYQFMF